MPVKEPSFAPRPDSAEPLFCGREDQLSAIHARLRAARAGRAQLVVVQGPPGVGKTALIRRFLHEAEDVRISEASGEEGEMALAYGVMTQLVCTNASVEGLLPEDKACTAGARLLSLAGRTPQDGVAVLVVDDAHWADLASLQALTFALRRLQSERVLTLLAVQDPYDPHLPQGLSRLVGDDRTLRLTLDGLSVEQTAALSARLLPTPLPAHAVARLHNHTQGNPLHIRALLRQVPPDVLAAADASLPAPRSYGLLVLGRLARCEHPAQDLVAAASVLGLASPLHKVVKLADLDHPMPAVEQAVAQELLEERSAASPPELVFPHPLIRAAVYHHLGPARRAALHARAALVTDDPLRRMWHRVLATRSPDPALVADLSADARRQAVAGSWSGAASLAGHASRLATTTQERERLTVEAADALLCDGRVEEAAELVHSLPGDTHSAAQRYAQGHLALVQGETPTAQTLLDDAWQRCDTDADPVLARRIAERLSYVCLAQGRADDSVLWSHRADGLPPAPFSCGMLRFAQLAALGMTGEAEQGSALAARLPEPVLVPANDVDLLLGRGALRLRADDLEGSRTDLRAASRICRRGPAPPQTMTALLLGEIEFRLGHWDEATLQFETAAAVATDAGLAWLEPMAYADAAVVPALRGQTDAAAGHIRAARDSGGYGHSESAVAHVARAQAHLAAARGAPDEVAAALLPLLAGQGGTAVPPWRELLTEALIELGDHRQAEQLLDHLDDPASHRGRHSALSAAGRLRGCLLAARRLPQAAESAFRGALEHAKLIADPFERARAELDFGAFLRRTGKRTAAIEHLRPALCAFAELGAAPHAARCERELASCGHSSSAPTVLTPQELTVARLATTGLTNRQIARRLALSVKTVEFHLGHVYGKLGIASRMGLREKLTQAD
uniref:AAA family ATPase n=1 Tax=Streptomyces sp. NBC_00003 TaxID=2903608 RepID=A0AAU2UXB0_9ACTN